MSNSDSRTAQQQLNDIEHKLEELVRIQAAVKESVEELFEAVERIEETADTVQRLLDDEILRTVRNSVVPPPVRVKQDTSDLKPALKNILRWDR